MIIPTREMRGDKDNLLHGYRKATILSRIISFLVSIINLSAITLLLADSFSILFLSERQVAD